MAYRLFRLRAGKTAGLATGDVVIALASLVVRLVSLPLLTLLDLVVWPIVRLTFGRGSWWVVEVRFHGPDAEFVRIAEASSMEGAEARRRAITAPGQR